MNEGDPLSNELSEIASVLLSFHTCGLTKYLLITTKQMYETAETHDWNP